MAKKKKKKGTTRRRRSSSRRMSGIGAIDMNAVLFTALGGVASDVLDRVIPSTIDRKLVEGGKIAVGIFLPQLVKDAKTKAMLQGLGSGLIAVGTSGLMRKLGFFQGPTGSPDEVDELAVAIEGLNTDMIAADVLGAASGDMDIINADVLGQMDLAVVNGDMDLM